MILILTGCQQINVVENEIEANQAVGDIEDGKYYYLAHWEWIVIDEYSSFWAAPYREDILGLVDLRSIPQQSLKGGIPQGYGFFAYSRYIDDPGMYYLGNNLDSQLNQSQKDYIKNQLNISDDFLSLTIRDILWEILTTQADPTGEIGVKPIMPTIDMDLELHLVDIQLLKVKS